MERLRYYIAQFLSYTLHPGIMPTVGTILILGALPETFEWNFVVRVVTTVFLGTYIGPFLGIVILRLAGTISSVHLVKREERIYPYLIGAASMIATGNHLERAGVPVEITWSVYLSALVVIISTILLPFFKSSAHAAGVFALYALYICLHQRYGSGEIQHLIIGAMVLGSLSWARLELKRHTLQELLSGALLGFIPMFLLLSK